MFIKFEYPVEILFYSNEKEKMQPEINFMFNNFKCKVHFESKTYLDKPYFELKKEERIFGCTYFSLIEKITFEIADDNRNRLKILMEDKKLLLNLIITILNKVLRCLRIFGWSWHIHEHSAKYEEDVDFQLVRLKVQVSEDREKYNYLIDELKKLLAFGSLKSTGCIGQFSHLPFSKLSKIEEAIADKNLDILREEEPTETEFLVNSREHLDNGNFRMAIIESIIALEIALTRYIRVYFEYIKKFSKKHVDNFLNSNFDLSTRLYIIPSLTLNDSDYSRINYDLVLKGVSLRNKLIHREEDCLIGVPEDKIDKYVTEIIKLSRLLNLKVIQIKAKPEMRNIADKIRAKFRVNCDVTRLRNHRFNATIYYTFSIDGAFFKENKVIDIINTLSELLIKYDNSFVLNEHLIVRFYDIYDIKLWAYWSKGKTVTLNQ